MINDVILAPSLRSNLLHLDSVKEKMAGAALNLGTGKRVHSAAQDPYRYFTASALNSRATSLVDRLSELELSIKTAKAADDGMTTITKLLRSAKAKAYQAQQSSSVDKRASFVNDYNELLDQIENVAKDAKYNGKNLLAGGRVNDVRVNFNVNATSRIVIKSVDYTDVGNKDGLNLTRLDNAKSKDDAKITMVPGTPASGGTAGTPSAGATLESLGAVSGDVFSFKVTLKDGSERNTAFKVDSSSTVTDLVTFINSNVNGVNAEYEKDAEINIKSFVQLDIEADENNEGSFALGDTIVEADDVEASGFESSTDIDSVVSRLSESLKQVEYQASSLGGKLGILDARKQFNRLMVNNLEAGSDVLIQANVSREAAKLQSLQTSQDLGFQSASMTVQSLRNVLRLF